jgi:hypothetical protein
MGGLGGFRWLWGGMPDLTDMPLWAFSASPISRLYGVKVDMSVLLAFLTQNAQMPRIGHLGTRSLIVG